MASLTPYHPFFLLINYFRVGKISKPALPHYLRGLDLTKIVNEEEINGETLYSRNEQKIFDFLDTRVAKLHKCFDENFESHYIKTESTDKHYITDEIMTVLKS